MNKKILLTVLGLGVIALTGFAALNSASAFQGDYTKKGPNYTPERHEAMQTALNNNDYEAWKNLMQGKGRVTEVINEQNFSKFAEAHKLAEEGKFEQADAIRKELGLRTRDGQPTESGYGQGKMRHGRTQ